MLREDVCSIYSFDLRHYRGRVIRRMTRKWRQRWHKENSNLKCRTKLNLRTRTSTNLARLLEPRTVPNRQLADWWLPLLVNFAANQKREEQKTFQFLKTSKNYKLSCSTVSNRHFRCFPVWGHSVGSRESRVKILENGRKHAVLSINI